MPKILSRRSFLKAAALQSAPLVATSAAGAEPTPVVVDGWIGGKMTGARALVDCLVAEGTCCVFGIPGAQQNELWDTMKERGLDYLLVTHEFSAAGMADGYARSTGRPGVLCVVPGPGVTNVLTGLGEALLDGVPIVCIAGDVSRGEHAPAFQVHELPQEELLRPVTKVVYSAKSAEEIPIVVRQAFQAARSGEPGPVGVVIPYDLLLKTVQFASGPEAPPPTPFDQEAFDKAVALLAEHHLSVGIYAGMGCMDASPALAAVAEMLQAPVATSVSGKGVIDETHPFAVGWGYGPQGTGAAEMAFKKVDLVLAIGVRYSEVATGFYSIPRHRHLIHVDINPANLGKNVPAEVCVAAESSLFLSALLAHESKLRRKPRPHLIAHIEKWRREDQRRNCKIWSNAAVDPMAFVLALRRNTRDEAKVFVDVTMTEHWAAEAFQVRLPRTYFNPTDNQSMGWSIPAAIGAQQANSKDQVVTITGDGCFLFSAMELATAARAALPVKVFVLDDRAYHYMQAIQKPAYLRTTATHLPTLDYESLARALGVGYNQIISNADLDAGIHESLMQPSPVLTRVCVEYGKRPVRWIEATKAQYIDHLSNQQKLRFLARLGSRALDFKPELND